MPEFTFKIIPEPQETDAYGNAHSTVRDVEVYSDDSGRPSQHLIGCDLSGMEAPPAGADWFRAEDFNFDGYLDIYLVTNWGATGNQYGCVWLFNPAARRFDYNKEFSDLPRFWLDPESKTIFTFDKGGAAGAVHFAKKYKVEGNRPVLIWSENQDWDWERKEFHCVVQELHGKKMVTVRDEWGGPDSGGEPCVASALFPRPGR